MSDDTFLDFTLLDFTGKTLLLTGASGFIGAHLARALIDRGGAVHAVSRGAMPAHLRTDEGHGTLCWHQLDLGDAKAVRSLMEEVRPRIIFHLASHVAGGRDVDLVLPTFLANLASTVYLLEAAARLGCDRFVQVGSLEEPDAEEGMPVPSSPYAAAKAAASSYGRMFHQLYDVPVTLARLFMVYGPAQRDLRKLIPYLILSHLDRRPTRLSSGRRPVDWIFVDDVVEGLMRLAVTDGVAGKRVDLGTGTLITIREMVEELYRQLAADEPPPFGTLPDRPYEQVRRAQVENTKECLGWSPRFDLAEGLHRTLSWYRREFESGRLKP